MRNLHKAFPKVLLALPHNRYCIRMRLDWGGEGRGEGADANGVAPSPHPSPPQLTPSDRHIDRGGEGAGIVSPDWWRPSPRSPSRGGGQAGRADGPVRRGTLDFWDCIITRSLHISKNDNAVRRPLSLPDGRCRFELHELYPQTSEVSRDFGSLLRVSDYSLFSVFSGVFGFFVSSGFFSTGPSSFASISGKTSPRHSSETTFPS